MVFETNDMAGKWNGTYNGNNCDMGTYIYTINFTRLTGETGVVSGNVILVR